MSRHYFETLLTSTRIRAEYPHNPPWTRRIVLATVDGSDFPIDLEFDRVRGNLTLIATALYSLEAACFILGTPVGGRNWLKLKYPKLHISKDCDLIEHHEGGTIAEALGITGYSVQSYGDFDLLTLRTGDRSIRFLASHSYLEYFQDLKNAQREKVAKSSFPELVSEMQVETDKIFRSAGLSSLQREHEWEDVERVVKLGYLALNISGRVDIYLKFQIDKFEPTGFSFTESRQLGLDDQLTFKILTNLALWRYQPERLLQRPFRFTTGLNKWYRTARCTPALSISEEGKSSREKLSAKVRLDQWLRAGGLSLAEIQAIPRERFLLFTDLEERADFVRNHRKANFEFSTPAFEVSNP